MSNFIQFIIQRFISEVNSLRKFICGARVIAVLSDANSFIVAYFSQLRLFALKYIFLIKSARNKSGNFSSCCDYSFSYCSYACNHVTLFSADFMCNYYDVLWITLARPKYAQAFHEITLEEIGFRVIIIESHDLYTNC